MDNALILDSKDYFRIAVKESCESKNIKIDAIIQNYVSTILQDYIDVKKLNLKDTLAEVYLRAHSLQEPDRSITLKGLGEKALYVSGFFSDSLSRKVIDLDYYIDMGTSAYTLLSSYSNNEQQGHLFRTVSDRFLDLVEVLAHISDKSRIQADNNILSLFERYLHTGSDQAKTKLAELGVVSLPIDQLKLVKQR